MRQTGELVQWNNKSGYGFVRDATGRDYYVHISKVSGGVRPRLGDRLTFATAAGRKGRVAAIDVVVSPTEPPPPPSLSDVTRIAAGGRPLSLGLRLLVATALTALGLQAIREGYAPLWFGGLYVFMGAASGLLYRFDKLYALSGRWRVSELNLHAVDLAFGIIGGLAAQEFYRHKTVKPRFAGTTWSIALLHLLLLTLLALGILDFARLDG